MLKQTLQPTKKYVNNKQMKVNYVYLQQIKNELQRRPMRWRQYLSVIDL